jgi:hypothetical protein
MRRLLLLAVLAVAIDVRPSSAAAILIDFEGLRHNDAIVTNLGGNSYISSGFQFFGDHPEPGNLHSFCTLGTEHGGFAGSTALYHCNSNGEIALSRTDGGAFDLLSISFAEQPSLASDGHSPINGGAFTISVEGEKTDGSTITAAVSVDDFLRLTPFAFSGFTDLVGVRWVQGPGGALGPTHQFDDVRVAAVFPAPPAPVPEPPMLFLVATIGGLAGIQASRRRRRSPAARH